MTLLIDGNNLAFREGHSKAGLSHRGVPTGAVFGFLGRLRELTSRFGGEVLVCWDSRENLRKAFCPSYKANRGNGDPDPVVSGIFAQMELLRGEILPRVGWANQFLQEGYEADDLIAALCRRCRGNVIVSSDTDLFQLLGPNTSVWRLGGKVRGLPAFSVGRIFTYKLFQEEYGCTPKQWVEVKAIAGDTSDNVIGVPGVGIKTAVKHLNGTATPKVDLKIADHADIIAVNRKLVSLPWEGTNPGEIGLSSFNEREFVRVCREYGMDSLVDGRQ